ncbi:phage tail assembly protein [Escherichia coli]|nr:phage tail assembly protein [Escherichia coli]
MALVHSHPGGLPWLSEADRRLQVQSDLPWWLVYRGAIHKFRCVPHLTGRRFEHGVTDCYTLFRDAYHLAGIEMPDFHREDDWWRNGQNLYLDNLEATGLYQVPLSAAQPGDVLLCCFGSSVPNHAAIYCGDGELLHHIPEQLSKRERYTDKWQRRTHSLWRHRAWARICLYGDLQRFGRRIDLRVKTGAEAIRALATQLPSFRQKLSDGWYQVRIAGQDVSTSGLTAQLHEALPDGAVIHIVPRVAGAKSGGVFQIVLGAAAIAGSFFTAGATLAAWGTAIGAGGMTGILFSLGASMVLGGVAQMLAPKARTPRTQTTDNGKQNTYFSSLDNMVAQGNVLPVLYGEMRVGSRVVSQEISTADEGDGGQVVVIGR